MDPMGNPTSFEDLIAQIEALPGHGRGIKDAAESNPWGVGGFAPGSTERTDEMRAWAPTPGEDAAFRARSRYGQPGERLAPLVQGLADKGGLAGQLAAGVIEQPYQAANSVETAIKRPSLPNVTAAAFDTAMVMGRPVGALKALGAGYGAAGAYDIGSALSSPANAVDMDAINAKVGRMSPQELAEYQKLIGAPVDGKNGPATRTKALEYEQRIEDERKASQAATQEQALARIKATADAERDARIAAEQGRQKGEATERTNQRVAEAKDILMRDLSAAREPVRDKSLTGQLYDKLGILTPLAGGIAGGMAARAAKPYIGFTKDLPADASYGAKMAAKVADDYVNPILAGSEVGGSLGMAPIYASAYRTDPTNPEYRAWSNYRLRLPDDAKDAIGLAENKLLGIPSIDPSVTQARADLADYGVRGKMMLQGGLGGLAGNVTGAAIERVPDIAMATARGAGNVASGVVRGVGRLKGEFETGANQGRAAAATADYNATIAAARADEATRALSETRSKTIEAQNRSSAGTALPGPASPGSSGQSPGQGRLPPPESGSNQSQALTISPEAMDQLNALFGPMQQRLGALPSQDQVNQLLRQIGGPQRIADDQFNALMDAFGRAGGGRKPPVGGANPNDAMRYFDPLAGASGQSQSQIVRDAISQAMAGGQKFGRRSGDITQAEIGRKLDAAGAASPIAKSQLTNRYQALNEVSKAQLGKDLSSLTEPEWTKLRAFIEASEAKSGKGGKTLAVPLVAGATAAAVASGSDQAEAGDHHSYYQPRNKSGQFDGAPKGY